MDITLSYPAESGKKLQSEVLEEISDLEYIKRLSQIYKGEAEIENLNVEVVGIENDSLVKSRFRNSHDIHEDGIILSKTLADDLDLGENDMMNIFGRRFKVIEILDYKEEELGASNRLLLNRSDFQKMFNKQYEADYVIIETRDKILNEETVKNIMEAHKEIDVELFKKVGFLGRNIDSLKSYMTVICILIIIMCSFLVIGNFQGFLSEYRKQFALLRAVGGTMKQSFYSVFVQCTIVNFSGAILGILGAYLSTNLLKGLYNDFFGFTGVKLYFSLSNALTIGFICFISFEILMLVPAYRIRGVLPSEIVNENEEIAFKSRKSGVKGRIFLYAGLFVLTMGFLRRDDSGSIMMGVLSGLLLILWGYYMMKRFIERILKAMLPLIKRCFGNISFVAVKLIIPQVKKNTIIILSISTMVIINVFGANVLKTLKSNNDEYYKSIYFSDIVLESRYDGETSMDHDFKLLVDELPGVECSSMLSWNSYMHLLDEKGEGRFGFRLGDLRELSKKNIIPPVGDNLKNKIILTKEFAKINEISIGDKITLIGSNRNKVYDGDKTFELEVINLIDEIPRGHTQGLIDWENEQFKNESTQMDKLYIFSEEENETLLGLEELKKEYPEIKFNSLNRVLLQTDKMFKQRYSIFILAMFFISISLIIGIVISLINNMNSKRKDFAILRTLKVTQKETVVLIAFKHIYIFF